VTAVSETGSRVLLKSSGTGIKYDEDGPLSAHVARYAVVNNVLHSYESCGQHRINWWAKTTSERVTLQPTAANTFELLTSIPFPATLRFDRTHFRFVWRLGGSIDDAAETATFRLVLSNPRTTPSSTSEGDLDHADCSTTSTTDVVINGLTTLLANVSTKDPPYLVQIPTLRGLIGSQTADALVAFYRLDVWVKVTNAGGGAIPTARLSGLLLREFIG
jgi:hypothetical protein